MADDGLRLGAYLEEWLLRRRSQLRPATVRNYRQTLRRYLVPQLGDLRLDELDRPTIERHYARLLAEGGRGGTPLSPRTIRLVHAVLRRALEDAVLDGLIDANPARSVRPPRHNPADVELDDDLRVWTAAQAATFLEYVDGHEWRNLWHLAIGTGARRGELLGLRWRDVDLAAAQVRIRRSLSVVDGVPRLLGTKTSRSRRLSIGASVVDALRRERAGQLARRQTATRWDDRWGLVFTDAAGGPVSPMAVTKEFHRLVREADVPAIRLHDVRHSNASILLEQGVPIKVISERLGHTTIAMTMDTYAHLLPAMDEDAAGRLEAALTEPGTTSAQEAHG